MLPLLADHRQPQDSVVTDHPVERTGQEPLRHEKRIDLPVQSLDPHPGGQGHGFQFPGNGQAHPIADPAGDSSVVSSETIDRASTKPPCPMVMILLSTNDADPRVTVQLGPCHSLRATFDTPHGTRVLT